MIVSEESEEDATRLWKEVKQSLATVGFELKKFRSNASSLREEFVDELTEDGTKVLGVKWTHLTDVLLPAAEVVRLPKEVSTKRELASALAQIYDPCGLFAPVVTDLKIFLQDIWKAGKTWDEPLSEEEKQRAQKTIGNVYDARSYEIPRWFGWKTDSDVELHVFSDASQRMYATVAYLRIQDDDEVHVALVASRSRLAPVAGETIPRLELLGAVLASRLGNTLSKELKIPMEKVTFWTDSSIVFYWLGGNVATLPGVFVRNRVQEVQKRGGKYRWVPGELNPADLPTRGVEGSSLQDLKLWNEGPSFLKEDEENWPVLKQALDVQVALAIETEQDEVDISDAEEEELFSRLSSFDFAVRVTAWILRWRFRKRSEDLRVLQGSGSTPEPLTTKEYLRAKERVIGYLQREAFAKEVGQLEKNREVSRKSVLWQLNPKMEGNQMVVGGRLEYATVSRRAAHPWILDGKHRFVQSLVKEKHLPLHVNAATLHEKLRKEFWIIGGRALCRKEVRRCPTCRRFDARLPVVNEANPPLPRDRIQLVAPYTAVGVDYAGPLYTKKGKKCYLLLFSCTAVRAVHVELVDSRSLEDWLLAFRRFCARWRRPVLIRSDNEKTFRQAAKLLRDVEWKFNPPYSPWHGGFYEKMVHLVKKIFVKVVGKASLTKVEIQTLIEEVVREVNCRPLTAEDGSRRTLTPRELCGGELFIEENSPDDILLTRSDMTRRQRYVKRMSEVLKRRWTDEYLHTLQVRAKKFYRRGLEVKVGDVGFLYVENSKRKDWPLARVEEVHQGIDEKVRSLRLRLGDSYVTESEREKLKKSKIAPKSLAEVPRRMGSRIVDRSVQHFIPLEVSDDFGAELEADVEAEKPEVTEKIEPEVQETEVVQMSEDGPEEVRPELPEVNNEVEKQTRRGRPVRMPARYAD